MEIPESDLFREIFRIAFKESGKSHEEVAAILGVSKMDIIVWLAGSEIPESEEKLKNANTCNMNLDKLERAWQISSMAREMERNHSNIQQSATEKRPSISWDAEIYPPNSKTRDQRSGYRIN